MNRSSERLHIDDNLILAGDTVSCFHCSTVVGRNGDQSDYLGGALLRDRPSSVIGDALIRADSAHFIEHPVVVRQRFCPGCKTLLATEVVLAGETFTRARTIHPTTEDW